MKQVLYQRIQFFISLAIIITLILTFSVTAFAYEEQTWNWGTVKIPVGANEQLYWDDYKYQYHILYIYLDNQLIARFGEHSSASDNILEGSNDFVHVRIIDDERIEITGLSPGTTSMRRICHSYSWNINGELKHDYNVYYTIEVPEPGYTITYDAHGGSGAPASQAKTPGTALTLSTVIPTHENSSAGKYTVTLNANGGSVSPASLNAARTTSYTFKEWNTREDGTGTSYMPGATYTEDADATLFAQWNSSTTTEAVTLPSPTWSGHTFHGWATSDSAASGITGNYTPKKNITLFATWTQTDGIEINADHFPDSSFRSYIKQFDKDGNNSLSGQEIPSVTRIDCANMNIASLKGIEFFTALTALDCSWNDLTALDLSNNTAITWLSCDGNRLTSLNLSRNTALTGLYCAGNQLTNLDLSKNTALTELGCEWNQLTSLILSKNTALSELACHGNQLTSLNLTKCTALTVLNCYENQLTSLDLSKNTALTELVCSDNQLTSLDLSHNTRLIWLACTSNQLEVLDISECSSLVQLINSTQPTASSGFIRYRSDDETMALSYDSGVLLITSRPDFVLPTSLKAIGAEAFMGGTFTYVKLPEQAVSIGRNAFAGCANLAYIYIPAATTEIDSMAFGNLQNLTILGAPNSAAEAYAQEHHFTFRAAS